MSSPALSPRMRSILWLLLQAAATVASILLAFAIDAWWDRRTQTLEKNALLQSVRSEMLLALKNGEHECRFREASLENVRTLLQANAAGSYTDTDKTLERRLADMIWYSDVALPTAAINSLLDSGHLSAVEDIQLRAALAEYPQLAREHALYGARDQRLILEVVAPFMGRESDLLHLSNESFRFGRPGDGESRDPAQVVPVAGSPDYTKLLGKQEFTSVLVQKLWIDVDVQSALCTDVKQRIQDIVSAIDRELQLTS